MHEEFTCPKTHIRTRPHVQIHRPPHTLKFLPLSTHRQTQPMTSADMHTQNRQQEFERKQREKKKPGKTQTETYSSGKPLAESLKVLAKTLAYNDHKCL